MGILEAFGAVFCDANREKLAPCPYSLERIAFIDKRRFQLPRNVSIIVAADVKNPLLGPAGATHTFGRQKGLYRTQQNQVDKAMAHYRDKVKQTFHCELDVEGGGAAGGIASVLLSVFQGTMASGIDLILEASRMEEAVAQADLVITGEGQTDAQTLMGKVPLGVAHLAKRYDKPCLCLSGALAPGYEALYDEGMTGIFSSADRAMDFHTALRLGPDKLEHLAFNVMKMAGGLMK
jgi:glycerate kinase